MSDLREGMCRVLVAPCGCFAGADVTDGVPGFCRSAKDAREDLRGGFSERQVPIEEFRSSSSCNHVPQWGRLEVQS